MINNSYVLSILLVINIVSYLSYNIIENFFLKKDIIYLVKKSNKEPKKEKLYLKDYKRYKTLNVDAIYNKKKEKKAILKHKIKIDLFFKKIFQ